MLNGRGEHTALLSISVICCIIGAIALTVGLFLFYMPEYSSITACWLESGGCLLFFVGMSVGKYTKHNSQR
jgi:hypothetical protein